MWRGTHMNKITVHRVAICRVQPLLRLKSNRIPVDGVGSVGISTERERTGAHSTAVYTRCMPHALTLRWGVNRMPILLHTLATTDPRSVQPSLPAVRHPLACALQQLHLLLSWLLEDGKPGAAGRTGERAAAMLPMHQHITHTHMWWDVVTLWLQARLQGGASAVGAYNIAR